MANRNDSGTFLTIRQACARYNLSRACVMKYSKLAGALIQFPSKEYRINVKRFDEYLTNIFSV